MKRSEHKAIALLEKQILNIKLRAKGLARCKYCKKDKKVSIMHTQQKCKECYNKHHEKKLESNRILDVNVWNSYGQVKENAELFKKGKFRCNTCSDVKKLEEFNRDSGNTYGYRNRCKECEHALRGFGITKPATKKRKGLLKKEIKNKLVALQDSLSDQIKRLE